MMLLTIKYLTLIYQSVIQTSSFYLQLLSQETKTKHTRDLWHTEETTESETTFIGDGVRLIRNKAG